MIKKNMVLVLLSAGILATALAIMHTKKDQQAAGDLLPVDLHILKLNDGWGYEVLVDKKVFIHQDCIPAIASFKQFGTEAEALAIGNKVIQKIKQGHKPSLTVEEINDAHIRY